MTISFDLDDTLIPGRKLFETERQNLFQRLMGIEKLRAGTPALFRELQKKGHRIYIYTTSFRSESTIRWMLFTYGLSVDAVINQYRHDKELKANRTMCSKYPPAFKIDLHIDDSPGLQIEGERFNFRTIIVDEKDPDWVHSILENAGL